jgi:hypothetical protein
MKWIKITYSIRVLYFNWRFFKMLQSNNNEENDQITNTAGAFQSDGRDVEFSQEHADEDDLVAQARSKAADQRAKEKNNNQ